MKIKFIATLALLAMTLASCDETTDTLGTSLNTTIDHLDVASQTFNATSRSVAIESVISRNSTGYLGCIKDPETGAHITGDFMTQFNCLESFKLAPIDSIASRDEDGKIIADSCEVRLFYTSYYGDSLATMKTTVYELARPMMESEKYYSDFDPLEEGYVREGGLTKSKAYTLENTSEWADKANTSNKKRVYVNNICIRLNEPYTDKNGVTYNNFGTYILRLYYEHPEYFRSSYAFINNVLPGLFFKHTGGLGSMAYVSIPQLNIYYNMYIDGGQKVSSHITLFNGTEEVLQTTTVTNENDALQQLVADNSCTYIKSPSGIFTELTLPVDEMMAGHENDTINTAKIVLNRINNSHWSEYSLPAPSTLLMLETDSVKSFFEKGKLANYKNSYLASFASSTNRYSFGNISDLITQMYRAKTEGVKTNPNWLEQHPNWNKIMLIPVKAQYMTYNNSSVLTSLSNDMSLTSTRLQGGTTPITINVIYSKFK